MNLSIDPAYDQSSTAALYWQTARYLKPRQVLWRLLRYLPRQPVLALPCGSLRTPTGRWRPPIAQRPIGSGLSWQRLLNLDLFFDSWTDERHGKLALYTLHYMAGAEPLSIDAWMDGNPLLATVGWDPYPTSLRLVNWIKCALHNPLHSRALKSLALQAEHLSRRPEYHLLANHLFANAKALVFAGTFLAGPDADRWFDLGMGLLQAELQEQILGDGAHFERSPSYHTLILDDVLDLVNLAAAYPQRIPESVADQWRSTASQMLSWMNAMSHPDGEIALFNDSAFGFGGSPAQVRAYAARLEIPPANLRLGASGYIRLVSQDVSVWFDAAPIGPDYQPGHAHSDTLSFELSRGKQRLLVNSGTTTYDDARQRQWERGTAAHNTIRVDETDQSEIWGSFRVARRAYPVAVATDHQTFAEAAHDGYRRLGDPVLHHRRLDLSRDALTITDSIEGSGEHKVEIFFHLHPGCSVPICLDPLLERTESTSSYSAGFNRPVPKTTVCGVWKGRCPQRFVSWVPLHRGGEVRP